MFFFLYSVIVIKILHLWIKCKYLCKKESCLQDSPPAAGRFRNICLSAASGSCLVGLFLCNRGFHWNPLLHKKNDNHSGHRFLVFCTFKTTYMVSLLLESFRIIFNLANIWKFHLTFFNGTTFVLCTQVKPSPY